MDPELLYAVACVAGWAPLRAASGPRLCCVSLGGFASCLERRDRLAAVGGCRAAQRHHHSDALVRRMARHAASRRVKSPASAMLERRPGCASEDWVSQLPKLIHALCEDWHLSLDDVMLAAGAWEAVAWCKPESGLEE